MEATNKWTYALGDEENYNGIFFDSKEDALDEAMQEAKLEDVSTVWVGQVEQFQPVFAIASDGWIMSRKMTKTNWMKLLKHALSIG